MDFRGASLRFVLMAGRFNSPSTSASKLAMCSGPLNLVSQVLGSYYGEFRGDDVPLWQVPSLHIITQE